MIKGDLMKNEDKKSVPMGRRIFAAVLAGLMIFVAVASAVAAMLGV